MSQIERTWQQWSFADKTAVDALAIATEYLKDGLRYGFTYTSDTCRFCVIEPAIRRGCFGALMGENNSAAALNECNQDGELAKVDLSVVFQIRLFGKDLELRWERGDGDKGRLTVSSDNASAALSAEKLADIGGNTLPVRNVRCREQVYMIWGKRSDSGAPVGWTKLTSARIGALWVPWKHEAERGGEAERIVLTAREYFEVGEMGNVAFVGNRLTGFRDARNEDAELAGAMP